MSRSISLRTYFTIVFVAFSILISVLISVAIGSRSVQQVKKDIGESLANTAYQMADKMDAYMWSRYTEVLLLSRFKEFQQIDAPDRMTEQIEHLQAAVPTYSWIGVLDLEGTVVAATQNILVGENIAQRPVYLEGIKGKFIGDVHDAVLLASLLPNPSGEPMKFVDISMPLQNESGQTVGVLAAHLSWKWADAVRASLLDPLYESTGLEMLVLGAQDNIVLLGKPDEIGTTLTLPPDTLAGSNGWSVAPYGDGETYVTGYAVQKGYMDFDGFGWKIIVRQPIDSAYHEASLLLQDTVMIGLASSLLFIALGWLITRRVSTPITELASFADRYQKGTEDVVPMYRGIKEIEKLHFSLRDLINRLTESHIALDALDTIAHHDPLTGIPNRTGLNRYLTDAKNIVTLKGMALTILCLDLDDFKHINDTYGHDTGDKVLVEVASRITRVIRTGELAARLGGDEFLVVLISNPSGLVQNATATAERIIQAINVPFPAGEDDLVVGCSIGGAFWQEGMDMDEVIHRADEALYQSKHNGRNKTTLLWL